MMLSKETVNGEEERRLASERRIMFKDGEGKLENRDPMSRESLSLS